MLPIIRYTLDSARPARGRIRVGVLCALLAAAATNPAIGAENAAAPASPWAFNLNLYMWLPGLDGKFSTGTLNKSMDKTFIDIVDASHRIPLGFMGRFEAKYERFGLYLDGDYFNLDFSRKTGPRGFASVGLETEMGILDYGVMYRLSGPPDLAAWEGKAGPNRLDVYAGGRTIWLANTITPQRLQSHSASKSLTSPVIGGRIHIDFNPDWFVKLDGNIGGFGADNVDFSGGILGTVGYRTTAFGLPTAIELGYKALRVDVSDEAVKTRATMSGPFVGATAFW